jgi:C1A family cysteine protease
MKKTSLLVLCTFSLNGVMGTEITSSPEENNPEAQINTTPQLAVRKTGYHAPEPEVLRAAQSVIAKQRISTPSSSSSSRLSARAAARAAARAPQKPKGPQITQLANIDSWPASLVYDQESLGSCTANSMGFIIRYLSVRNSKTPTKFSPNPQRLDISRLYQYYNTRFYEGVLLGNVEEGIASDTGASMAGSILAIDKFGCTPETFSDSLESVFGLKYNYQGCPYVIQDFAKQPNPEAYRQAFDPDYDGLNPGTGMSPSDSRVNLYAVVSKNIKYADLIPSRYRNLKRPLNQTEKSSIVSDFVKALSNNQPIYFGTAVDLSFFNDQKGYIPTPNLQTFTPIGGHAIVLVGYGQYNQADPNKQYFKFINSWGPGWGQNGFGFLDEEYVANVNIFWTEAYAVDLQK